MNCVDCYPTPTLKYIQYVELCTFSYSYVMTIYYRVEAMQIKCVVLVVDSEQKRLKMKYDYSRLFTYQLTQRNCNVGPASRGRYQINNNNNNYYYSIQGYYEK